MKLAKRVRFTALLSLSLALFLVGSAAAGKNKRPSKTSENAQSPKLLKVEPTTTTSHEMPGLFQASDLKWSDGTGTLAGMKVAVVSEDPVSGAKAMFVQLPAGKAPDPRLLYHYHTDTVHTYVISGAIGSTINGKQYVARAGDYARMPASASHADTADIPPAGTRPSAGAILFMVTEGSRGGAPARFDTVAVNDAQAELEGEKPTATTTHGLPGLFKASELKWEEGTGTLAGLKVSLLSENPVSGARAMFVKLPAGKTSDPRLQYHYHTDTVHTYVISGSIATVVNGKQFVAKAGDYTRMPANAIHADTADMIPPSAAASEGAMLLLITEGSRSGAPAKLDTVVVKN